MSVKLPGVGITAVLPTGTFIEIELPKEEPEETIRHLKERWIVAGHADGWGISHLVAGVLYDGRLPAYSPARFATREAAEGFVDAVARERSEDDGFYYFCPSHW